MPMDQKRWVWIGLDLGPRRDHSAIAVVERVWEQATPHEFLRSGLDGQWSFRVRMLERLRLDTPYPDVVKRVDQISMMPLIALGRTVVVDGTGVGPPVVDMLRRTLDCRVNPVLITGGSRPSTHLHGGYESVPRSVLLTALQVLVQHGRLTVSSRCRHAETLRRELLGLKLNGPGSEEHDDLAIAVALAVWKARVGVTVEVVQRR